MPTGYTAPIEEDPNYTFEQYVWRCARAFGALILMRDDDMGTKVPQEFEPSDWNAKELAKAQSKLAELEDMTLEQAAVFARADFDSALKYYNETRDRNATKSAAYAKMRARVEAWEPPDPEHAGLKKFMLEQLTESMRFGLYEPDEPKLKEASAWLVAALEAARRDVAYHTEEHGKELRRTYERNRWVRLLRESVPQPEKV